MQFDIQVDSFSVWALDELTAWRNQWSFTTAETVGRRVVAELGYLFIAVVGLVEATVRFFFAAPVFLISYCGVDKDTQRWLWGVTVILLIGNGMLSAVASVSALGALLANPCSTILEHKDLQICFHCCLSQE